jgi:hypothetical protein
MIDPAGKFDVDDAVIDPAECFAAPTDVLNDARLISQAEGENMRGTDRPRLREVKLALLAPPSQRSAAATRKLGLWPKPSFDASLIENRLILRRVFTTRRQDKP